MVNSPLIRPYFFWGVALGGPGPLGSHEGRRESNVLSTQATSRKRVVLTTKNP